MTMGRTTASDHFGWIALLCFCLAAGTSSAQSLGRDDVVGTWRLTMTPDENGRVTMATETGRIDMTLSVSTQGSTGLSCRLDGEQTECRLRRRELVIVHNIDGAGRMTYTLTRGRDSLAGQVRLTVKSIPFGSFPVGRAEMTRR